MSLFGGNKESDKNKKSLIIYFSRAGENWAVGNIEKGNTEVIAEYIQEITGADMFKVERKISYAEDYQVCIEESKEEIRTKKWPEIVDSLENVDEYEVIYIGTPVYWGTLAGPLYTQLEKLDFTGKIVRPFTTHEGSGLGSVVADCKKLCAGADVKAGLAIQGSSVHSAKAKVEAWV